MKITKNIHNTNIPQEIKEGKLVEGNFDVTGKGQIIPVEETKPTSASPLWGRIKQKFYQWMEYDAPNLIDLGKLLEKDQNNPNID